MRRYGPPGLSAEQRANVWNRWEAEFPMREIARMLRLDHGSIRNPLLRHGGIRPAERRRCAVSLTLAEREAISRGVAAGESGRSIAKSLSRSPSTVSREIKRHGGRSDYRASRADTDAWDAALRPKRCLLAVNSGLRSVVASKLKLQWSPEQISGWLKSEFPKDKSLRVSHETIYRSLFIQARGALKKELMQHLRTRRSMRARTRPQAMLNDAARYLTRYPSESVPQKSRIGRSQVIGKAISSAVQRIAIS